MVNHNLFDSYNLYLVTISVFIAILASYTTLKLAGRIAVAQGWGKICWLIGGALGMGSGIWSMHFIGMLAFKAPVPIDYDFVFVLISMLPAILVSGLVLFIVSHPNIGSLGLACGSLCMGGGITATHYLGMAAMRTTAIMHYDWNLVLISVLVAIAVSSIALYLTFQLHSEVIPKRRLKQFFAAIVMGFAILSMHYTGMLALTFKTSENVVLNTYLVTTKDANLLAIGVAIGTLIILGSALMTTFFDRQLFAKEESHRQLKTILEGIKVGVLVIGSDSEIYMSNQAVCDLLGKTEIELQYLWQLFCKNHQSQSLETQDLETLNLLKSDWTLHEIFCAIISHHAVDNAVMSLAQEERGKESWLLVNVVPQFNSESKVEKVVCTFSDITNLKHKEKALQTSEVQNRMLAEVATAQAQELEKTLDKLKLTQSQLVQQEKMSSLGQMVAGIAHEVNNPISIIYGNLIHAKKYTKDLVELLHVYQSEYPQASPKIQAKLEEVDFDYIIDDLNKLFASMKFGSDRMRKIVLSLRNFSRLDEAQMKGVDIHEGLDNTLLLLAHRVKATENIPQILIYKSYGNLPIINCYAGQLNQVFKNILDNAIDALRDTLEFYDWSFCENKSLCPNKNNCVNELANQSSNLPSIYIHTELLQPSRVSIEIANNGPIIPESIKSRIFDPFFTTKPVGSGTGLGLSISYQIIHKHGGILECISKPGWGTKFRIEIPIL